MPSRDDDITNRALFGLSTIAAGAAVGSGLYKGIKQAWPEAKPIVESMGIRSIADLGGFLKRQIGSLTDRTPFTVPTGSSAVLDQGFIGINNLRGMQKLEKLAKFAQGPLGAEGWKEVLVRSTYDALHSTGFYKSSEIDIIMSQLRDAPPSGVMSALGGSLETKLGGMKNLMKHIRINLGAGGSRGPLREVISDLADVYTGQDFLPGGAYWQSVGSVPVETGLGPILRPIRQQLAAGAQELYATPITHARALEERLRSLGLDASVTAGTREFAEGTFGGRFIPGQAYQFIGKQIPGGTTTLPYAELQLQIGGETSYVALPYARQGYTPYGVGGMGVAAVPQFSIPEGGKLRTAPWNQAIGESLYGTGEFDNLAALIYKGHKEKQSLRAITEQYEARMRARLREVSIGPGELTGQSALGRIHQATIFPLERTLSGMGAESAEDIIAQRNALQAAGITTYPLSSPGSMASGMGLVTQPFHEQWNVLNEGYPFERRPLQSLRPFGPTTGAVRAMEASPILGAFSRGVPIGATSDYLNIAPRSPTALTGYFFDEARYLRAEELLVSNALAGTMETRTIKDYTLKAAGMVPNVGSEILPGQRIGIEARTGQIITGAGTMGEHGRLGGRMIERVTGSRTEGGITYLTTEQVFPLQDQAKIFGVKATLRQVNSVVPAAGREWGAKAAHFASLTGMIEAMGSVELLKKNPALIQRQMAEALLAFGKQRWSALSSSGAAIPSSMQELFGGGTFASNRFNAMIQGFRGAGQYGVETGLLRMAKEFGLPGEEMGMMAGYFHRLASGGEYRGLTQAGLSGIYQQAGISNTEMLEIAAAKKVVGMPEFPFGDYPSYTEWGRGTIEPRAIRELLWQDWRTAGGSPAGKIFAAEIESRRIPRQVLGEMETALASLAGKEIPAGLETIPAAEAIGRLQTGEGGGFLMQLPQKVGAFPSQQIYVPKFSPQMNMFAIGEGAQLPQNLLEGYLGLATGAERLAQGRGGAAEGLESAGRSLYENVYKQWLLSTQARGEVIGTTAPVVQSWVGRRFEFSSFGEFIEAQQGLIPGKKVRYGLGRDEITRMYEDMISYAKTKGERKALRKEMRGALKGNIRQGLFWRHPTHYPFSLIPAEFQAIQGAKTGVYLPKVFINTPAGKVDISGAYGMNMDVDFDRAVTMIVGNEKTKDAVKGLLTSNEWRAQQVESAAIQYELEKMAKVSVGKGSVGAAADTDEAIRRLVGIQVSTPKVSIAAQKLRLASANAPAELRGVTSTMLAMLEQSIISSKKGGMSEFLANSLENFTRGAATGEGLPEEEFKNVWKGIWGKEEFELGDEAFEAMRQKGYNVSAKRTFRMQEMYEDLSARLRTAQSSGEMRGFENVVRGAASANRGRTPAVPDAEEAYRRIEEHRAGLGDPASALVRSARAEGTGAQLARAEMASNVSRIKQLGALAKKHWKAPVIGIGAALAARYLLTPSSITANDNRHEGAINALGEGESQPSIRLPRSFGNRMITTGGGISPSGYSLDITQDIRGSRGTEQIMQLGASYSEGDNVDIRVRDRRGELQPENINKMMNDDYQYARPPAPYNR